jgi:phage baseplate assembly protein W
LIKYYVEEALVRWEPRIEVQGVLAWPDPGGVIRVEVAYTIRSTQEQQTLALQLSGG